MIAPVVLCGYQQRHYHEMLHCRPNVVQATSRTTRDELNNALRRAAGRDNTRDDAA
jgi:hypothetical protein